MYLKRLRTLRLSSGLKQTDIADILGARERKEGYIEGNGYQVTWTFGHLCTLKEPHEYTPGWKSWLSLIHI